MKGRNGPTSFLPSQRNGGIPKEMSDQCLTAEQTKQIYDKTETGEMIKITKVNRQDVQNTSKQAMLIDDTNPYEKALLSGRNLDRKVNSQIEQWLILSDNIVYIKSEDKDIMNGIDIKPIDYQKYKRMYRKMNKEGGEKIDIDFGESPEVMKDRYMDMYDEVYAEVVTTSRFYENVDLSTTYLGRNNMQREEMLKAEESFPISEQGFVNGKLINGEGCQILLDTGVSKSYMSKCYYLRCRSLHSLPKFASKMQRIQVGNGQYVGVLFVIPVIVEIHGHKLEVFTLVSEIFDNIDMVLGIKKLFELEGVIDTRESNFKFLSRSIPIFPRERVVIKPGEKKLILIETLFVEEISGMAIIKIVDQHQKVPMMLKLKFIRNKAMLDITNNSKEIIIFDKKTSIGILDLRSLGYYKIKQGVLQQNVDKYYQFKEVDKICADFNGIMEEKRQEEKNSSEERYPWLEDTDERKYMTDKEILDKYINLKDSCLTEQEKNQVMDMLYEYKDVFSLRDEIGTCPNIEVNIEVMDSSPFFIRPYSVKEQDRNVLDKEMKRLCYLGILKEGFSAYLSPVM